MVVLLSNDAYVKTLTRGEITVGELETGDSVVMYDPAQRYLSFVPVQVERVDPLPKLCLLIKHMRWINVLGETWAYASTGIVKLDTLPNVLNTYCVTNPLRMVNREIIDIAEYNPTPASKITWNGPSLMWAEGILVGQR